MYKKRISKWQLHKNCKAAEKEAVLQCIDTQKNLGVDLGQPLINGKPVEMHLIDRHRKGKRKTDCLASEDEQFNQEISTNSYQASERKNVAMANSGNDLSAKVKRTRVQRPLSTILVSFSRITDPTEYRNAQDLLMQLDHYIDAKLGQYPHASMKAWEESSRLPGGAIHISYVFQDKTFTSKFCDSDTLFARFNTTFHCLAAGQVRPAWKLASEGAAMVRACLQQQSPYLLGHLLGFIGTGLWRDYAELCNQLLRQFSAMAMTILGQSHPITYVCRLLQSFSNGPEIAVIALQKTFDAFESRLGGDHKVCLKTQEETCWVLLRQNKCDEARQHLLNRSGQFLERSDAVSRCRVLYLTGLLFPQGRDILVHLLKREIEKGHLGAVNSDAILTRTLIRTARGDHAAAESVIWIALSGSLVSDKLIKCEQQKY